jgi:hypothetical protein
MMKRKEMINFTIDAGVLALPPMPVPYDVEYEKRYIPRFIANIRSLQMLERRSIATVSYEFDIRQILLKSGCDLKVKSIRDRITKLKNAGMDISYADKDLSFFHDIFFRINPIPGKKPRGKIGIYENAPLDQVDQRKPDKVVYDKTVYPENKHFFLKSSFSKYLGYLAELNKEYKSEEMIFMVTSGDQAVVKTAVNYGGYSNVVNVVGVQKTLELCPQDDGSVVLNTKEYISNTPGNGAVLLEFGKDITHEAVDKVIRNNRESGTVFYYYLETLKSIARFITDKICIAGNPFKLVEMISAHGCLCSLDSLSYHYCTQRKFTNHAGQKEVFRMHLKPVTKKRTAIRIYLKWDVSKFFIGNIGNHPLTHTPFNTCSQEPCLEYKQGYELQERYKQNKPQKESKNNSGLKGKNGGNPGKGPGSGRHGGRG